MAGHNYYFLTALPPLGELGTPPPLTGAELLEFVRPAPNLLAVAEALLLGDDLLSREAVLAGEVERAAPAVLTAGQLRDEKPLPAYLVGPEGQPPRRVAADAVWEAYYRHLDRLARRLPGCFLRAWVGHEVALRNALAARRADTLELSAQDYLVAPDLGAPDADFGPLLAEWASAPHPLAGLRTIDRARWAWIARHDAWFTFSDDELAAYTAKLMLLGRWQRLAEADEAAAAPSVAPEPASRRQARPAEQPQQRTSP